MNEYAKRSAALLAAVAATVAMAACGSSGDEDKVSGRFDPVAEAPSGYAEVAGEATLERSDGGTDATISVSGLQPDTGYEAHLHSGGCDQADPGGPHFKFDPSGSEEPPNEIHFAFTSDGSGDGEATASSDREVPVGEAGSVVLHLAAQQTTSLGGDAEAETVFVHEGDHHGDAHQHPDEIACAELEGGADSAASADAGSTTIVVENGEPVGGVQALEYSAGEEISFRVDSDVADEVHVHGYDLMKDVPAGGSVELSFLAEIEGIFEVELEGRGEQIAELRVNP